MCCQPPPDAGAPVVSGASGVGVGDDPAPAGGKPPRGRGVPESGGRIVGANGWGGTAGAPEADDATLGGTPMSGGIDAGEGATASDGELGAPGAVADAGATADAGEAADADAASDGAAGLTAGGA